MKQKFVLSAMYQYRQANITIFIRIAGSRLAVEVDHVVAGRLQDHNAFNRGVE